MTAYDMSGHNYEPTPTIMMKGKWLEKIGFEIGSRHKAECQKSKIIITVVKEKLD